MDSRDTARLGELMEFQRTMLQAQFVLESMKATNALNAFRNEEPTYTEADFIHAIETNGIGFNDFPYYKG